MEIEYEERGSLSGSYPYSFPFKPYLIQQKLMNVIFKTIDDGKIGIFVIPEILFFVHQFYSGVTHRNWKIA